MASPRTTSLLRALGAGLVVSVPLTLLALAVREQPESVFVLDDRILESATALARDHPGLRQGLIIWQSLTQPIWLNLAVSGACLLVWRYRGLTTRALWSFGTLMTVWFGQYALKELIQRARPILSDPVSHAPGYSFPSGHAANTTGAMVVLVVLLWPVLPSRAARLLVAAAGATVVLITGLDRVLLGVHYPTDVLGGFLVGGGIVLVSWLAFGPRRLRKELP